METARKEVQCLFLPLRRNIYAAGEVSAMASVDAMCRGPPQPPPPPSGMIPAYARSTHTDARLLHSVQPR